MFSPELILDHSRESLMTRWARANVPNAGRDDDPLPSHFTGSLAPDDNRRCTRDDNLRSCARTSH